MDRPSAGGCARCGADLEPGATNCAACGASTRRGPGVWRVLLALFLLLGAFGLALLGGTCAILGYQSGTDRAAGNIGLAMLAGAGVVVYGVVALLRQRM